MSSYKLGPIITSGGAQTMETVSSKTSSYAIQTTDSGTAFDTTGAVGSVTFTLPAISTGQFYTFTNATTSPLVIQAPMGVVIILPASPSSAGGTQTTSVKGSSVTLYASSGIWYSLGGPGGSWVAA